MAVYAPRGHFVGDAFSEDVFRCVIASQNALLCGNPNVWKDEKEPGNISECISRTQLEDLCPCIWFTANSQSAHPKQEYMHVLEIHSQNFVSLLTLFSSLINFNFLLC